MNQMNVHFRYAQNVKFNVKVKKYIHMMFKHEEKTGQTRNKQKPSKKEVNKKKKKTVLNSSLKSLFE